MEEIENNKQDNNNISPNNFDTETNQFETETLEYEKETLQEQIEKEEEEPLPPPPQEKNEGKSLNVTNIFAIGFIILICFIFFIMIIGKKAKVEEKNELEKAYTKNGNYEFKENPQIVVVQDGFSVDEYGNINSDQSELNSIRNAPPENYYNYQIPNEYELPQSKKNKAPSGVAPVGSSGSKSEKPDTRNSRSPRNVEGIKGLDKETNNSEKIYSAMNGEYMNPNNPSYQKYDTNNKDQYIQNSLNQINGTNIDSKNSFYNSKTSSSSSGEWLPTNSLWDGTIISGVLITAINTDNPGVVMARVTENVYSSYDHRFLLIPEGTVLFGEYNYDVSYGQAQIQVGWNLIIRPDGYRIQIGNYSGVTAQGASGYKGDVSNHPWQTLKALGMIAIFSVLETEVNQDLSTQNNAYVQNAMTDVYAQTTELENKILNKALDIKPTLKIEEGTEIKLITNNVLQLPPCEVPQATKKYQRKK